MAELERNVGLRKHRRRRPHPGAVRVGDARLGRRPHLARVRLLFADGHRPASWEGARFILNFGAVWHRAVVRINGAVVGDHTGGYTSFEFDVTDHLRAGVPADLVVDVEAPADKREIVHGKQRSIPRDDYDGVSFTPTSGIWQSVWLEARGRTFARTVELRGDSRTGIDLVVTVAGDASSGVPVTARVVGGAASETVSLITDAGGTARGRIELDKPRLWRPTDPHLYRVEVSTDRARAPIASSRRRAFVASRRGASTCSSTTNASPSAASSIRATGRRRV